MAEKPTIQDRDIICPDMSREAIEIVFVCSAETEEDEKVRHYYEGIQRLKDGKLPSSTQLFQTGKLLERKRDPSLSVVGTKQLLNIKLKLDEGKVWSDTNGITVGYGCEKSSFETFKAIVPENLKSSGSMLSFLSPKCDRNDTLVQLRDWSLLSKRVILIGTTEFFTSILGTPLFLRNCDVYRVSCTHTADSLSFANIRLLYRSDFSSHFPLNTLFSWKHILYTNNSVNGNGIVSSASDASLVDSDGLSEKTSVAVGYSHGFATSTEDINPVCRICQVSYFEMPNRRLIKPCKCSGTVKYVHKDCLNTWRATSAYAYTTCNMCHYHYKIRSPLISKYLVNEDFTFILAVLIMFPLCYLVGCVVHATAVAAYSCVSSHSNDGAVYLSSYILGRFSLLFLSTLTKLLIGPLDSVFAAPSSVLHMSLLGCNMVGVAGFFATSNPYSLVSLSIVSYFALQSKFLAVCCVIAGWGTALRELHLMLMMSLRSLNDWIGNIIIESS